MSDPHYCHVLVVMWTNPDHDVGVRGWTRRARTSAGHLGGRVAQQVTPILSARNDESLTDRTGSRGRKMMDW